MNAGEKKGAYPKEYMGSWWRISETSVPNKKEIYSSLNMEENTDADYRQANFLCWKWYLLDPFENFRKECMKTYSSLSFSTRISIANMFKRHKEK